MAEDEYIKRRWPLEFETQRIQLAAEVAKLKACVIILEAPNEIPDDPQVTISTSLKSKTRRDESEEKSQSGISFHFPENEMIWDKEWQIWKGSCWITKNKMGKSSDADRVSSNDKEYVRSHRNSWDPEEDVKLLEVGGEDNHAERNFITETPSYASSITSTSKSR